MSSPIFMIHTTLCGVRDARQANQSVAIVQLKFGAVYRNLYEPEEPAVHNLITLLNIVHGISCY